MAPGATGVAGQVTAPTLASLTATPVRVTLPVFVTTKRYGRVDPTTLPVGMPACLSKLRLGLAATSVSVESVAVTGDPVGGVPDAVAVLATWPASMSACVSVYVAEQVVDSSGSSVVTGQTTVPTLPSATAASLSVTLPVFVTTNSYVIVEPALVPLGVPACLSSVTLGAAGTVVSVLSVAVTGRPDGGSRGGGGGVGHVPGVHVGLGQRVRGGARRLGVRGERRHGADDRAGLRVGDRDVGDRDVAGVGDDERVRERRAGGRAGQGARRPCRA